MRCGGAKGDVWRKYGRDAVGKAPKNQNSVYKKLKSIFVICIDSHTDSITRSHGAAWQIEAREEAIGHENRRQSKVQKRRLASGNASLAMVGAQTVARNSDRGVYS